MCVQCAIHSLWPNKLFDEAYSFNLSLYIFFSFNGQEHPFKCFIKGFYKLFIFQGKNSNEYIDETNSIQSMILEESTFFEHATTNTYINICISMWKYWNDYIMIVFTLVLYDVKPKEIEYHPKYLSIWPFTFISSPSLSRIRNSKIIDNKTGLTFYLLWIVFRSSSLSKSLMRFSLKNCVPDFLFFFSFHNEPTINERIIQKKEKNCAYLHKYTHTQIHFCFWRLYCVTLFALISVIPSV